MTQKMKIPSVLSKLVPTLYEDDAWLAVVKPSGLDTGDARDGSQRGLVELLSAVRSELAAAPNPNDRTQTESLSLGTPGGSGVAVDTQPTVLRRRRLHAANRLSRYESGILVLGKNLLAAERIRSALKSGQIELEFAAVVTGRMNVPHVTIGPASEHREKGRKPGRGSKHLPPRSRKIGKVDDADHRTIVTRLYQGKKRILVRCRTRVENTHALRAQLRAVKLRLVGDPLHDRTFRQASPQETCLHLTRMTLPTSTHGQAMTLTAAAPDTFTQAAKGVFDVERALHAGLVRRLRCFAEPNTDCFRLLSGNVEDVPGLVVEKYGPVILFQLLEEHHALLDALPRIGRWYVKAVGAHAVYLKRFVKNRTGLDDELTEGLHSPKPFVGKPVPEQVEVLERDLRFAIRPYDGFSVGLFLDQRENRSQVRKWSEDKQVLNLFAYTCGFSVAAAAGGAARTVSVDISAKHLEWGRTNFSLNGIDVEGHEFHRADSMEFLDRCVHGRRPFDLVIIDPPTFAHGRRGKRQFSILEDLAELIAKAVAVLNPDGMLLLSTNFRRLSRKALRDRLHEGAQRRGYRVLAMPALPDDFAMDPDHAKSILAQFA